MSRSIAHSDVRQSQDRPVILVDADNTLWDTDELFADAQLQLFLDVERACKANSETSDRLDFVRSIDQALAEQHHLGLRYPPRLLIIALSLALSGKSVREAVRFAWTGGQEVKIITGEMIEKIEKCYFENLRKIPLLMPGVETGLTELHATGARILILTEGHRDRVIHTARSHGIMTMIDRVFESKKNCRLFERIFKLTGNPSIAIMVGDQITKDIIPAKQAGFITIYIKGGFQPKWESSDITGFADFYLDNFSKVPNTIAQIMNDKKNIAAKSQS